MPHQTYDVYFSGKIMDGMELQEVKQKVGQIFKAGPEQLELLFSGKSVKVKGGVDEETASRYRKLFRDAGALIDIALTPKEHQAASSDNSKSGEGLTLLPANTGSLEDCAPKVQPQPLPDVSHISLAAAGTVLEQPEDTAEFEIDISNLSMEPANSGTLEDCKKEVEPYPVPDISHLELDKGKKSD